MPSFISPWPDALTRINKLIFGRVWTLNLNAIFFKALAQCSLFIRMNWYSSVRTWKVPEAPFPVICSKYPFSTDLCRQFFSTSGLRDTQTNIWHIKLQACMTSMVQIKGCLPGQCVTRWMFSPWPALYVELGEMLFQIFLDEDVWSLLGLAEASHDQWQRLAQGPALRSRETWGRRLLAKNRINRTPFFTNSS